MARAKNVRLKHSIHEADSVLYFYDGELPVKEGVVSVPADRPEWVRNAWINGYDRDPKTGEYIRFEELLPADVGE